MSTTAAAMTGGGEELPSSSQTSKTASSSSSSTVPSTTTTLSFVDIGANLLDDRYIAGRYRGRDRHPPDLPAVLERATAAGVSHVVVTAGTVEESRAAVQAVRAWRHDHPTLQAACTVGVHPTRCQQVFGSDDDNDDHGILNELLEIARDGMRDGTVVAIGELGLDYDRLEFGSKDVQHRYLKQQLQHLAKPTGLPLFLHNRNVGNDLLQVLHEHDDCWTTAVVHSFDDSYELASQFLALNHNHHNDTSALDVNDKQVYIGINGCSLRTPENLDVVRQLPLDRLLLETDCPYCEVRPAHAGYSHIQSKWPAKAEKKFEPGFCVKSRQEPCHIRQVAEIVAGVQQVPLERVARQCFDNSLACFFASSASPANDTIAAGETN